MSTLEIKFLISVARMSGASLSKSVHERHRHTKISVPHIMSVRKMLDSPKAYLGH